mgnify:CR=1 FL=1
MHGLTHATRALMIAALILVSLPCWAAAWDVTYEGSAIPNDPTLGSDAWVLDELTSGDLSNTTALNGVLNIVDTWADRGVRFLREGQSVSEAGALTIEARFKVTAAGGGQYLDYLAPVALGGTVGAATAFVGVWPDRVGALYGSANLFDCHFADMTQYHTLRIALAGGTSGGHFIVWLDDVQVLGGAGSRQGGGVFFGTAQPPLTSESYWDYVRYSRDYLPVPEPSGLLALAGGMSGMLALSRRRSSAR